MQQLVKMQRGEEWTPLVGVDPKTGDFVYGEKRQPTIEDIEMVRQSLMKCQQAEQNTGAQLQQLPQQFGKIAQQDLANINQERARRFDWVANPELMKHELEVDGVGKRTVEQIRNDFISLFPAYHQRTVGVDVAADLFVAMQIYAARLKEAESGKAVAETLKAEAARVEPTASARGKQSNPKFGVTEFTMEGMPE